MSFFTLHFRTKAVAPLAVNYPITQLPDYPIPRRTERGYVLLVLLLFVALLSIGFMAAVRKLDFQVKRDREEEMIHRGVQYSRAIKRFYKKFGRYPTRVEELESTNNQRFLRKRFKDPMNRDRKTGKELDFKFLHLQDVQMSFNSPQAGVVSVQDMATRQAGAPGALNGGPGFGGNGPSSNSQNQATPPSDDQSDNSSSDQQVSDGQSDSGTPPPPQPLSQQVGANGAPQVFGGGAIVGVASANKDKTIREFNKKDHYNQWQFIYDPTTDRGGLLMTPNQPPLQTATQNPQQNGQPQNGSNFGSGVGNGVNQMPQQPQDIPNQQ